MKPEDIEIINENGLLYDSKFMLNFPKIQTSQGMKQLKSEIIQALEIVEKVREELKNHYCIITRYHACACHDLSDKIEKILGEES